LHFFTVQLRYVCAGADRLFGRVEGLALAFCKGNS